MTLTLRFVRWLASKLQRRDIITEDGALYLSRYRVLGWMPGSDWRWPFSVYLHRFHLPDQDEALHNHPWKWAVSLILTGEYLEVQPDTWLWREPGSIRVIRDTDYHRVDRLRGETWTLFITGPKVKSWGFMVPGRGHVPWRERLAERGIEVEP